MDGELQLAPGFSAPPNTDYAGYHQYIEDAMPAESPYLYGLHPNAEIGFLTTTSENLFRTIFEMQPRDAQASGATTVTREDKVGIVDDFVVKNSWVKFGACILFPNDVRKLEDVFLKAW